MTVVNLLRYVLERVLWRLKIWIIICRLNLMCLSELFDQVTFCRRILLDGTSDATVAVKWIVSWFPVNSNTLTLAISEQHY